MFLWYWKIVLTLSAGKSMNELQKFEYITHWYASNSSEETSKLKVQENIDLISQIESIIEEPIPNEIREIFVKYDGEDKAGYGTFIGHSLVSLEEIIKELINSQSSNKPKNPHVSNPKKSEEIIVALNAIYRSLVPEENWLGFLKKKWYKLSYEGSVSSRGGPYFYRNESTSNKEREILKLSGEQGAQVQSLLKELHELERETYNWDAIKCTLYGDGSYAIERIFYNFSNGLSSFPEGCIKTIDYHFGWLPMIKDHGGNFIGIDLDPDKNGTKGQVIVYGRDEKTMFVLTKSWTEFLELVLEIIQEKPDDLLKACHLHDYFKKLLVK